MVLTRNHTVDGVELVQQQVLRVFKHQRLKACRLHFVLQLVDRRRDPAMISRTTLSGGLEVRLPLYEPQPRGGCLCPVPGPMHQCCQC